MAKKLRIGVIGCGKIARVSHIPRYQAMRETDVVALFDSSREQAEARQAELVPKAEVFTDIGQFLEADMDAVSVCTPTVFHYDLTMAALAKGLHVLCEKPMAPDLTKATRMVNASHKAKRVLHINQSLYYSPVYATIKGLLTKGRIGDLIHMRCIRASTGTPAAPQGWSPGAKWFESKKHGGGVLLDIGIHMADMLRWYGGPVREVAADVQSMTPGITASDAVSTIFRMASGATAVLELHWNLGAGAGLLELYGTTGTIRHGFTGGDIEVLPAAGSGKKVELVTPKKSKGQRDSFQSFVRAVQGKAPSPTPGELGRDALALCDAIQKASDSGKFEKVRKWKV